MVYRSYTFITIDEEYKRIRSNRKAYDLPVFKNAIYKMSCICTSNKSLTLIFVNILQ